MDYTPEGLKDLKHVIVTMKLKDSTTLDTKGYFIGLRPIVDKDFEMSKTSDLYVWIYRKGSVHMFHLNYYYVDEIHIGSGTKASKSILRSYRDDGEEQELAVTRLKATAEALKQDGFSKENGLVDYEKYSDVPKIIKEDIEIGKLANKKDSSYTRSGAAKYTPAQSNLYEGQNWQRKEVSTLSFKRTTRYDTMTALTDMDAKIQEIQADAYEHPKLKKIPADTNKVVATDENGSEWDDYNYMCG